jgi:hypothetical protein
MRAIIGKKVSKKKKRSRQANIMVLSQGIPLIAFSFLFFDFVLFYLFIFNAKVQVISSL